MSVRRAAPALVALALLLAVGGCSLGRRGGPEFGKGAWSQRGIASWYGPGFNGKKTANGETYDMHAMTAAHKELPFDTVVEVRNLDNGKVVRLRINDRGPFVRGRIIDLSRAGAKAIDMLGPGTARVEIRARLDQPAAGPARFGVQVAAFRDRERARELASELRPDFDAAVVQAGVWHRVRVGGRLSRQAALELAARVRRRGYDAAVVTLD